MCKTEGGKERAATCGGGNALLPFLAAVRCSQPAAARQCVSKLHRECTLKSLRTMLFLMFATTCPQKKNANNNYPLLNCFNSCFRLILRSHGFVWCIPWVYEESQCRRYHILFNLTFLVSSNGPGTRSSQRSLFQ